MKRWITGALAALVMAAPALRAQEAKPLVRPSSSNIKDLQIRGRVQSQFGYTDIKNDAGSDDFSTLELRRVRMGMRGTLLQNVRAQLEANLVPGSDLSMRSAFIEWREHKPAYIKVGLDKPRFGFEENTSSAEILTVERTLIGNALVPGAMNGVSLAGKLDLLSYGAGIYTDRANRNADGSAEYLYNGSVQLTLDEMVGDAKLRVRGDYLSSDDGSGNLGKKFEDAMAASMHYALGRFDLRAEYMVGSKGDHDTTGFYVMPSIFLTDKFQTVFRYEQAESDKARGLTAPSRYGRRPGALKVIEATDDEPEINPQKGDDYMAVYVGANYYFAGHSQKLMAGVEFAELDNTLHGKLDMTTVYTAWRMLF